MHNSLSKERLEKSICKLLSKQNKPPILRAENVPKPLKRKERETDKLQSYKYHALPAYVSSNSQTNQYSGIETGTEKTLKPMHGNSLAGKRQQLPEEFKRTTLIQTSQRIVSSAIQSRKLVGSQLYPS
ncbi:hypothetical protein CEXT_726841 [Caerostris extrusa]|uniref:Uncharacterized protein n=1 Tax=Caerostris extrusa TaxID=172846 RepID=A0AAV4NNT5_CAEEX|nr:hypothetical protein CEXT_726841 [Caerostris extrusa]